MMHPAHWSKRLVVLSTLGLLLVVVPASLVSSQGVEEVLPTFEKSSLPPPPWYTAELHERVVAAGEQGLGYDLVQDQAVPVRWNFIKPGAFMVYPNMCTMAFVLEPGDKITSAGHCLNWRADTTLDNEPYKSLPDGVKSEFPDDSKRVALVVGEHAPHVVAAIGTVEMFIDPYASDGSGGEYPGQDWGVVKIDDGFLNNVDPAVKGLGGPMGTYRGPISPVDPLVVKYLGYGMGGAPRVGLATSENTSAESYQCYCATNLGDSGVPIVAFDPSQPTKALGVALGIHNGWTFAPFSIDTPKPGEELAKGTRVTALENHANNYRIAEGTFPNPVEPVVPGWIENATEPARNFLAQCLEELPNGPDTEPPFDQPCIEDPWLQHSSSPRSPLCPDHWLVPGCPSIPSSASAGPAGLGWQSWGLETGLSLWMGEKSYEPTSLSITVPGGLD